MRNLACGNQYMLLVVMQTASAKSRSAMWGASHQSAFMNSCLTISNRHLPYLPSRCVSPGGCGIQRQNYVAMFQGCGM